MTIDFAKLNAEQKAQHCEELLKNPAFVYLIEKEKKNWLGSFEGCKPEEVHKRDYCFARYKAAKDLYVEIEKFIDKLKIKP